MSGNLLSQLSPATLRVIAAAFIHEREFGKPMMTLAIRKLCQAEGASLCACLAIIRGRGIDRATGWSVHLDDPKRGFVRVPDEETKAALGWRAEIGAS